jgi:hypothetical protein
LAASIAEVDCFEVAACVELRLLQAKFSSGVTIRELLSVASVCAACAAIQPPGREAKRNFRLLMKWFIESWTRIGPWLAVVELRDERGVAIDGTREFMEKRPTERTIYV